MRDPDTFRAWTRGVPTPLVGNYRHKNTAKQIAARMARNGPWTAVLTQHGPPEYELLVKPGQDLWAFEQFLPQNFRADMPAACTSSRDEPLPSLPPAFRFFGGAGGLGAVYRVEPGVWCVPAGTPLW